MATYTLDHFTAADNTVLSAHTPDTGTAYTLDVDNGQIESNALTNVTFDQGRALANPPPAAADYKATATFTTSGSATGGIFLMLRNQGTGTQNYYEGGWDSTSGWQILLLSGGSPTTLDAVGGGPSMAAGASHAVEFEVIGSNLTLTVDGTLVCSATDSTYTSIGAGGIHIYSLVSGWLVMDDFTVEDGGGGGGGSTHTVSGRGAFTVADPAWLSVAISGRDARLTSGQAEPPNWYHVGMISWGTTNGAITAHPITRDLELIELPTGMTDVWYEFDGAIVAVIQELASP